MVTDKKYGFPLFFAVLMAVPIYFAIQLGKDAKAENWELLESGLTYYLIALWSTWIFTVSMAIYYKWTGRGNMLFSLNYGFVVVAFGLYAYFKALLLNTLEHSSPARNRDVLILQNTARHLAPIILATGYIQISVWWFRKKWHRK